MLFLLRMRYVGRSWAPWPRRAWQSLPGSGLLLSYPTKAEVHTDPQMTHSPRDPESSLGNTAGVSNKAKYLDLCNRKENQLRYLLPPRSSLNVFPLKEENLSNRIIVRLCEGTYRLLSSKKSK